MHFSLTGKQTRQTIFHQGVFQYQPCPYNSIPLWECLGFHKKRHQPCLKPFCEDIPFWTNAVKHISLEMAQEDRRQIKHNLLLLYAKKSLLIITRYVFEKACICLFLREENNSSRAHTLQLRNCRIWDGSTRQYTLKYAAPVFQMAFSTMSVYWLPQRLMKWPRSITRG